MSKKNKSLVSVIVPCYNCEDSIKRCIDSILGQSLKDIEIICINDNSSDNTLSILNEYSDIKIINNQDNIGPGASRNKALKIANGKYIGFVDSDDFIEKDMYKVMSSFMDDEVDLVVCSRVKHLKNKNIVLKIDSDTDNPKDLTKVTEYQCDKLFKKSIIDKYNIEYPNKYRFAEDFYFVTKYRCYCNKMKILKDTFYHYIAYNDSSITKTYNENILHILGVFKELKQFFIENNFYDEIKEEFSKECTAYYIRRSNEFLKYNNIKLKIKITKEFLFYLKDNFDDYKNLIRNYKSRRRVFYRSSIILMYIYILKSEIISLCLKIIKKY